MTTRAAEHSPTYPPTTLRVIEGLHRQAREHDAAAAACRELAARIQNPGDGVRVYVDELHGVVRFIGPPLALGGAPPRT